jgi:chromosome segregation ATPase
MRSGNGSEQERRIRQLRAEIVRLQVRRQVLTQRLNSIARGAVRNQGTGLQHAVHGLEVERDQLDARLARLQADLQKLSDQEPPPE